MGNGAQLDNSFFKSVVWYRGRTRQRSHQHRPGQRTGSKPVFSPSKLRCPLAIFEMYFHRVYNAEKDSELDFTNSVNDDRLFYVLQRFWPASHHFMQLCMLTWIFQHEIQGCGATPRTL
ncbi:hypothetical protein BV898_19881 [Hypsibius exemplaris]|uniref:Uncharacterized protein n=1 Tax=Hypsibius exemplaris TaxID=2072580 RepID=A0A9X6NK11_HYPEX|nr:hypothetical protein BV898_19881 [Hypsibius exemplaris]